MLVQHHLPYEPNNMLNKELELMRLRAYLGSSEKQDEKGEHHEVQAGVELTLAVLP